MRVCTVVQLLVGKRKLRQNLGLPFCMDIKMQEETHCLACCDRLPEEN